MNAFLAKKTSALLMTTVLFRLIKYSQEKPSWNTSERAYSNEQVIYTNNSFR